MIINEQRDVIYLRLNDGLIADSKEVEPGVTLDFDENGSVIGVEFNGVKHLRPSVDLKRLQVEYA